MQLICGWKKVMTMDNLIVLQGHQCIGIFTSDLVCDSIYFSKSPIKTINVTSTVMAYISVDHYGYIDSGEHKEFELGNCDYISWFVDGFLIAKDKQLLYYQLNDLKHRIDLNELVCDMSYNTTEHIMAIATSRKNLYLFDKELTLLCKLSDNEGWIQSINWQYTDDNWYLATCSNDYTIRIYKYQEKTLLLESVLFEHSDWVLSIIKHPSNNGNWFSAGADESIIHWTRHKDGWDHEVFGAVGMGQINSLAALHDNGLVLYGVTHHGALVQWKYVDGLFILRPGLSGHSGPVMSLQFHQSGCLFTCSQDRTTRVYASVESKYIELARAQVHGHAMQSLSCKDLLMTSAEEKVVRIFEFPSVFYDRLTALHSDQIDVHAINKEFVNNKALGASLPALGLTNKAIYTTTEADNEELLAKDRYKSYGADTVFSSTLQSLTVPDESQLLQHTLFPELIKIYGHGDVIFAIDQFNFNNGIYLMASSCKATTLQQASIRIHQKKQDIWEEIKVLQAHTLTITSLVFNYDGSLLASAGRDRSIVIHNTSTWDKIELPKAHNRIIWDLVWTSNSSFMTSSRDKSIKEWTITESIDLVATTKYDSSITCLAYSPQINKLAIGLENGIVQVDGKVNRKHAGSITGLSFNPLTHQLASSSTDHSILIK